MGEANFYYFTCLSNNCKNRKTVSPSFGFQPLIYTTMALTRALVGMGQMAMAAPAAVGSVRGFSAGSSQSQSTEGVLPQQVFGSGVGASCVFPFDWKKEEAFLRWKEDDDECLTMQLERLRLRRASDFDD